MNKKRLISRKDLKKAYIEDYEYQEEVIEEGDQIEKIEKLPNEIFQIIGESLNFIEKLDNME